MDRYYPSDDERGRSVEEIAREVYQLPATAKTWGGDRTINDILIDAEAILEAQSLGPDNHKQKYPVKKHLLYKTWWKDSPETLERRGELYGADPECDHEVTGGDGGSGVQCRRCNGWYCA